MSQVFASGGQSIGVSASTSVLPINTQDWSPLGWTGWIFLQSKGSEDILKRPASFHLETSIKTAKQGTSLVVQRMGIWPPTREPQVAPLVQKDSTWWGATKPWTTAELPRTCWRASVPSESWRLHGPWPARLLCPWASPRQEHGSGVPCPPPGDLPNPWVKPTSHGSCDLYWAAITEAGHQEPHSATREAPVPATEKARVWQGRLRATKRE